MSSVLSIYEEQSLEQSANHDEWRYCCERCMAASPILSSSVSNDPEEGWIVPRPSTDRGNWFIGLLVDHLFSLVD